MSAVLFLWVYTFYRQKNIRTKDSIECSNVRSSGLDVHLFIQCCASAMLKVSTLLLYIRTEVLYGIADVARLSFLAGTRNLVVGLVLCSRGLL